MIFSLAILVATPSELLKIQMQVEHKKIPMLKLAKEIYQIRGIRGLYKGLFVHLNRDLISYGVYFYVYFTLKDYLISKHQVTSFNLFSIGGLAGVISWIVCYPFDPVKTLIQTQQGEHTLTQFEAYKIIKNKHGNIGFFKGINPVLVRAYFVHGVIFYINELCDKFFYLYLK